MARPQKTKIEIMSDGTQKGTKVLLNGTEIRCFGLVFRGDRINGYEITFDLTEPEEGDAQTGR